MMTIGVIIDAGGFIGAAAIVLFFTLRKLRQYWHKKGE